MVSFKGHLPLFCVKKKIFIIDDLLLWKIAWWKKIQGEAGNVSYCIAVKEVSKHGYWLKRRYVITL